MECLYESNSQKNVDEDIHLGENLEIIDDLKFENLDANDPSEITVNYRPIITKIRKISKFFKKPKTFRKFQNYKECNLVIDVKTRWNSTFAMDCS